MEGVWGGGIVCGIFVEVYFGFGVVVSVVMLEVFLELLGRFVIMFVYYGEVKFGGEFLFFVVVFVFRVGFDGVDYDDFGMGFFYGFIDYFEVFFEFWSDFVFVVDIEVF